MTSARLEDLPQPICRDVSWPIRLWTLHREHLEVSRGQLEHEWNH